MPRTRNVPKAPKSKHRSHAERDVRPNRHSSEAIDNSSSAAIGSLDLHLFAEGRHRRLYEKLGAHPVRVHGVDGVAFSVWAPNAKRVFVIGDFNGWDSTVAPLQPISSSGIWTGFVPDVRIGALYKYRIESRHHDYVVDKADPFAFSCETPPQTASRVAHPKYNWTDARWMASRQERQKLSAPISIYEVHLGSFMRGENDRMLTYRELAPRIAEHATTMGFTHVELMPIMEHPFYGSWGYQVTGYFAPTSRLGSPEDLMAFVDHLHEHNLGVIFDWVPAHFPNDTHGLGFFDGTHLFEHADPRLGFHPDWNSLIFNYGRNEVRSFLLSSACFWLDKYHADALRIDGVASMLYLDYSRNEGEWLPNIHGGRENLEAISLLREINQSAYGDHSGIQTIAEESTAWPMVSRPVDQGGLGFGYKWDMGWMHDTLRYFRREPIHRKFHHGELPFRMIYAFHENFVLSLSHDEVVHQKGSLVGKMPGDMWQKFANLRLLYGYMFTQPGKKLLFMGDEFGQLDEWHHDRSLDWHLAGEPLHQGVMRLVTELNRVYRTEPALFDGDADPRGFEWIHSDDADNCVLSYIRKDRASECPPLLAVLHFTPVVRVNYRVGVPCAGNWTEILNTDAPDFGGSGVLNRGATRSEPIAYHGRDASILISLPPLGMTLLQLAREVDPVF